MTSIGKVLLKDGYQGLNGGLQCDDVEVVDQGLQPLILVLLVKAPGLCMV